jgi:hypothetical protein
VPERASKGGKATLRLTLHNPNQGATLSGLALTDTFPKGMIVASPLTYTVSQECGTPSFAPVAGSTSISLTNATVASGQSCVVDIGVMTDRLGVFTNTATLTPSGGGQGSSASATLRVQPPLSFLLLLMEE